MEEMKDEKGRIKIKDLYEGVEEKKKKIMK